MYTLDIGNGIDLMARYKYISDEDDRVTKSRFLTDAYDGFPAAAGAINPDWIPNVGLGGCVGCDDREADYDTFGISAGYQLHAGPLRQADLRVPPGRADRRHDRRGARGPRLRGEQRLRLRRVPDRQEREEPARPRLQLLPVGRRVRRHDRLPVGHVRSVRSTRTWTASASSSRPRPGIDLVRDAARATSRSRRSTTASTA